MRTQEGCKSLLGKAFPTTASSGMLRIVRIRACSAEQKLSETKGKPAVFGTQRELEEAERDFDGKRALEARKADERKADAKKVAEAYRHSLDVRRKATKEIEEADRAYRDERSKFVDKYGSYHMTYTEDDGKGLLTFGDLWDDFFERLFF